MQLFELFGDVVVRGAENAERTINRIRDAGQRASTAINKFGDNVNKAGQKMALFGGVMTAGVTVPLLALSNNMIELASDVNESLNVVDVTFEKNSNKIKGWAGTLVNSFGITEKEGLTFAGTMGSILKASGFVDDKILEMSKSITQLSGDLGSFKNLKTEEAFDKIRSGLLGESEPLKQIGILLDDTTVKHFAMKNGLKKTWEQVTQAEKIQWRYKVLLEATADAQGDFANTSDSYANRLKIFNGTLEKIKLTIGNKLLPIANNLIKFLQKGVEWFSTLDSNVTNVILVIAGLAAAIGPILLGLGTLIMIFGGVITAIGAIGAALSAVTLPMIAVVAAIGVIIAAVGGLIAVFVLMYKNNEEFRDKINAVWARVQEIFWIAFEFIKGKIIEFVEFAKAWWAKHGDDVVKKINEITDKIIVFAKLMKDKFVEAFEFTVDKINWFRKNFDKIKETFDNVKNGIMGVVNFITGLLAPLIESFVKSFDTIKETLGKLDFVDTIEAFNRLKEKVEPLIEVLKVIGIILGTVIAVALGIVIGLVNGLASAFPYLLGVVTNVIDLIVSILLNGFRIIKSLITGDFSGIIDSFVDIWEAIKGVFSNAFMAIIKFIGGFIDGVINFFKNLYDTLVGHSIIPDMVNGIIKWFMKLFDKGKKIVNDLFQVFKDVGNKIKDTFIGAFQGLWEGVKGILNSLIGGVNRMIRGLNNLNIKAPDWVPEIGGKGFSFNIPTIPKLETGTNYVPKNMLAYLHKGEAVVPAKYNNAGSKTENYNFTLNIDAKEIKQIADIINVFNRMKVEAIARGGI